MTFSLRYTGSVLLICISFIVLAGAWSVTPIRLDLIMYFGLTALILPFAWTLMLCKTKYGLAFLLISVLSVALQLLSSPLIWEGFVIDNKFFHILSNLITAAISLILSWKHFHAKEIKDILAEARRLPKRKLDR